MGEDRRSFVAWARESAHPLDGDDLALGPADLSTLAGIVGGATVVGLGETWHPVHEFLALNFRMARFLVEMGFTGVLLEGSLATTRQLDGYVNNGSIPGSIGAGPVESVGQRRDDVLSGLDAQPQCERAA